MKKILILMFLALFSFPLVSAVYCYQETFNVSTTCGGLATGLTRFNASAFTGGSAGNSPSDWYNGVWGGDSYVYLSGADVDGTYILINYTKPTWYQNSSIWSVEDYNRRLNLTIPDSCWKHSNTTLALWANSSGVYGNAQWGCINGTDYVNLTTKNAASNRIYEEGMYWDLKPFNETSFVYSPRTLETSYETYKINITYLDWYYSSASAILIYNGTSYATSQTAGSGNNIELSSSFTLPVNEVFSYLNKTFYWEVSLTSSNGTSKFNSSVNTQEVIGTNISQCGGSASPTEVLNLSLRDELTLLSLNGSIDVIVTWALSPDSTITKNSSFALTGFSSYVFCTNYNTTYYANLQMQASSSGYDTRLYDINLNLSNVSQIYPIYLLNDTYSTRVIVLLRDSGNAPLTGYTMKLYKKDISTNTWILIQEDTTDVYGQTIVYIVENSERYKFDFYDSTGALVKSTGEMSIACRTTICTLPITVATVIDEYDRLKNITSYDYSLVYANTSNTIIFTWSDTTGSSPTHRLEVVLRSTNETRTICNSTSTALANSLTCTLPERSGTYYAYGRRVVDGTGRLIATIQKTLGESYRTFWKEGLFWSFILLMTLLLVGAWSPVVGVVLYLVGFIAIGLFGAVYIDPAIVVAELVLGGIFAWAFRG